MEDSDFKFTRRRLPHIQIGGSVYFITFRKNEGALNRQARKIVLNHIKVGDPEFYNLWAVTVMPDHVHIILQPQEGTTLSRIMKGIKGASARKINKAFGTTGSIWRDESFDRIIRTEEDLLEKMNYMYMNSTKNGHTDDPDNWDGWYCDYGGYINQ
jgi:REP element-mobilizing transposase RayT